MRHPVAPPAPFRNIRSSARLHDSANHDSASFVRVVDLSEWADSLKRRDLQNGVCPRAYCLTAKQYNKPSPPEAFSASGLQPLESWDDAQAAKS